jgi:hypothetical protein
VLVVFGFVEELVEGVGGPDADSSSAPGRRELLRVSRTSRVFWTFFFESLILSSFERGAVGTSLFEESFGFRLGFDGTALSAYASKG